MATVAGGWTPTSGSPARHPFPPHLNAPWVFLGVEPRPSPPFVGADGNRGAARKLGKKAAQASVG